MSHAFEIYFHKWLQRQERLLTHLQNAVSPQNIHKIDDHKILLQQVFDHYHDYYQEKSKAADSRRTSDDGDVFVFLSPPWYTAFERSLLWLGEFQPSTAFSLVNAAVTDLTEEQVSELERAKAETRREERGIDESMARLQERVAAPPILGLARRAGRLVDGEIAEFEEAVEGLKVGMVKIVGDADLLRGSTVRKVSEILSPVQMLRFLAAAADFRRRVRMRGQRRDNGQMTTVDFNLETTV